MLSVLLNFINLKFEFVWKRFSYHFFYLTSCTEQASYRYSLNRLNIPKQAKNKFWDIIHKNIISDTESGKLQSKHYFCGEILRRLAHHLILTFHLNGLNNSFSHPATHH